MRARSRLAILITLELVCFIVIALLGDLRIQLVPFFVLFAASSALCILAMRAASNFSLRLSHILAVATVLRVPMLFTTPSLSDDVWRYLHDGRAQLAGVNPYRFAPNEPATEFFRGPEHARINHPELPTIYPPAAQFAFAAATFAGGSLLSWKLLLLACELAIVALLFRLGKAGIGAAALLYALHPLPIIETLGSGHMDGIAIAAFLAALALLRSEHRRTAGLVYGFSIAAKFLPAAYLPLLLGRNRLTFVALCAATVGGLYAIYGAFTGVPVWGSLATFADQWRSNPLLFQALDGRVPEPRRVAGILVLVVVGFLTGRRIESNRALLITTLAVLLLSPVVHPWYLLWLLPFAALAAGGMLRNIALTWTFTVVAAYAVWPHFTTTGVWEVPAWAAWIQLLPMIAVLAVEWFRSARYSARSATVPAG